MPKELPALYLVRLHASEAHCLNTVCSALTFQIEISQFKHKQNAIACHKAALPRRLQWRQQHIKWQSLNNLRSLPLRTRDEDSKKKNDENSKDAKIGFLFALRTRWFHWAKEQTSIDEKSLKSLPCFNWYLHLRPSPAQTQRVFWVPCCVCDRGRLIKLNTIHTQKHAYRTRQ